MTTPKLTQRHRNCLAAISGGNTLIGVTIGDIMAALGETDRHATQDDVRDSLDAFKAAGLIGKSAVDATRYVIKPAGLRVLAT